MAVKAPAGYWRHKSRQDVSYSPFNSLVQNPIVHELIIESPRLEDFLPIDERKRAVREGPGDVIDMLLTLHFASGAVRRTEEIVKLDAEEPRGL